MSLPYAFTPHILLQLGAAAMQVVLALYAWRHRAVAAAAPFAVMQSLSVLTYLANTLEIAATDYPAKFFWRQIWFSSLMPQGPLALAIAVDYAGIKSIARRAWTLLMLIPFIALLLMLTNDAHHLIWTQVWFDAQLQVSRGFWNWLFIIYSFLLEVLGLFVFASVFIRSRGFYRRQAGVLGLASATIWLGMGLRFLGVQLTPGLDVSVVGSLISSPLFAWGLFRLRAFDLAPVARDTVIEHMGNGMIVLDNHNRVVDVNPAARALLEIRAEAVGQDAALALSRAPKLVELAREVGTTDSQIVFEMTGKSFDARTRPLTDANGASIGRLILLHDITELRRVQERLLEQQGTLAVMQERERLARELHDGLGQMLAAAHLQVSAAKRLLAQGAYARTGELLGQLAETTLAAEQDMREYLLGAQTVVSADSPFFATLRQYLVRYKEQYGVSVALTVPGELETSGLAPPVAGQLLRIIQEALSNIRKHARTRCAHVSFEIAGMQARVVITDDGQGFDPAGQQSQAKRFGLQSMRGRAEAVGGRLEVISSPGHGTQIVVQVPCIV